MEILMSAGLNVLKNVLKDITDVDVNKDDISTQVANTALKRLESNLVVSGSITKLTSTLLVNPEIIASGNATRSPVFDDVTGAVVDVFSGFYLQAFQILTNLYGFSGVEAIAVLKENKGDFGGKVAGKVVGSTLQNAINEAKNKLNNESYKGLFNLDFNTLHLNIESPKTLEEKIQEVLKDKKLSDPEKAQIIEDLKQRSEAALNASGAPGVLGKMADNKDAKLSNVIKHLDVSINVGTTLKESMHTVEGQRGQVKRQREAARNLNGGWYISNLHIPITIIAGINRVQLSEIIDVLVDKSYKKSFASRWMEYKSGGITLSDLIFCTDLIKDYRKKHIKNSNDLSNRLEGKTVSRALSNLIENIPHNGETSYNMIVITKDELYTMEKAYNGKISNTTVKDNILRSLMAHSLTILDDEVERATIYISDIAGCIDIGYKKLSKNNKNTDLTDVMKYMMLGKVPEL